MTNAENHRELREPGSTAEQLTAELECIVDTLARQFHTRWVLARTSEGWQQGPVQDGRTREHPWLVDFDRLSDAAREDDRRAIREVLVALTEMGFAIRRRSDEGQGTNNA